MNDDETDAPGATPAFEQLLPLQFHATPGVEDWRVLFWGAHAFYRTGSFAQAAEFVSAIADAASVVSHDPDVDLRPEGVTIRCCSRADGALSRKDAELAVAISAAAHKLGLRPDPGAVQVVGIAVAQDADVDTRPFWEAAFGYQRVGDEDLVDPLRRGPHLWFHRVRPPRPGRGRTHIDISVPADQAHQRVQAAIAAGGRMVDESEAPKWWTIASPDNHGVDIAGWADSQA
ncbi:4a-hydroxytetrahydrobiopterin dehydratase [Glaciihabitans tibetensis]|uniref:Putative pterin-4-alpha-carbinolamine dehydratase n=1 Tax=Glaciihabitans tibetensis TaxID=1266600 RepID=A0A2T0V9X5_9MICO|nr:VOC family protein [Glaciihabitans tibetensis]PRY66982.1 4a-hydroxytetrahydrobiopterin dehydratase [Glaciihabitans tibetensis]